MRSKRPIPSLREIKSIHSVGIHSIPKVQRSGYLDLYTLGREKDRLDKEILSLDKRRSAAAKQLDNVIKRIIQLQKETREEEQAKTHKGMPAKPLKTMAIKY